MATKKTEVNEEIKAEEFDPAAYQMELVEIPPLFYDKDKYSAPVFVGVNGVGYAIPRGVSGLKVPRCVKTILEQSEYQTQVAGRVMNKMEGIKNLGEF